MSIWAIVPVKPFNRAKSRLEKALEPAQREAFAIKTFKHSLEVLTSVKGIGGVMVVSRDSKALAMARDFHAHTIHEGEATDLNSALVRAAQFVGSQGATAVLVLPADVPLVTVTDIESIIHMGRFSLTVVLAPDRQEDGTNALLVNPPGVIPFAFGVGSFQRHLKLAQDVGAAVKVYRSERLELDIDTPEDLNLLQKADQAEIYVPVQPIRESLD
jgi:2-phospho-L-lactate guanylyltransferase